MHSQQPRRRVSSKVYPMGLHTVSAQKTMPYNSPYSTMGKVVRVRPNIYIFVCDICQMEHRNIDIFLKHTESHFQSYPENNVASGAYTQVHSNYIQPNQATIVNGHTPFDGYQSNLAPPASNEADAITSSPSHESEEYIEEVFEITDLGYDLDGVYPTAENVVVDLANDQTTKPKNQSPEKYFPCSLCYRKYAKKKFMDRHKAKEHANIMEKLVIMNKAYKCLLCKTKMMKTSNSQDDAEKHIKTHFKKRAKK